MSKILFLLPSNMMHANLPADKRRELIERAPEWFQALGNLPIPVVTGLSRFDRALLAEAHDPEVADEMLARVRTYGCPYSHALLSTLPTGTPGWDHARWLVNNGTKGDSGMYFFPEFDVPASTALRPAGSIIPVLPDQHSRFYSECGGEEISLGKLEGIRAIHSGGNVLVPMWGVGELQKAFFAWQRFPGKAEYEYRLVAEFKKIAENGLEDDVRIFFMDMEAPLVGSHHGLEIWRLFGELLTRHGLTELFVEPEEACEAWNSWADANPFKGSPNPLIARNLGVKWTYAAPQVAHIGRYMGQSAASDRDQIRLAVATCSDALAGLDVKLKGGSVATLDADLGPITIGYDDIVVQLGRLALENDLRPDALRASRDLSNEQLADGQWLAMLIAKMITG